MRLVVCGGRVRINHAGGAKVMEAMSAADRDLVIAHGDAPGYDRLADRWSRRERITVEAYPVDAKLDGYRDDAPKKRNERMFYAFKPEACLAFPGGPGTRHMFSLCLDAGLPVYDVSFNQDRFLIWQCRKGRQGMLYREGLITP